MPDFASIFQMANKPTVALQSPMEAQARALQLQSMAGQQELQQGQIQQQGIQNQMLQQQFADTQRVRQSISMAASQPGDTLANISQALQKDGSPTALKYLENISTMGKNMADLDTAKLGLMQKHLSMLGNSIGGAANPQAAANTIIAHAQTGEIPPQQAQDLLGSLQAAGNDPKMFQTWKQTRAAELGASQELLGAITPKVQVAGSAAVTTQGGQIVGTQQIPGAAMPEVAKELQAYNSTTGRNVGIDDPGFIRWHNQMHPTMAVTLGGQAGAPADASKPLLNAGEEAMAQAIAAGKENPLVPSMRTPGANRINARAAAINGGTLPGKVDVAMQQAGMKAFSPEGTQGKSLIALDTATGHLAHLAQLGQAMQNGNVQAINAAGNYFQTQMGVPNANNFDLVKNFVIPEILKTAKGSGQITEGEEKQLNGLIGKMSSPAQIQGFVNQAMHIMGSKIQALNPVYQRYFKDGSNVTSMLRPESQQMLQQIGINFGGNKAAPQAVQSPQGAKGAASVDDLLKALGH